MKAWHFFVPTIATTLVGWVISGISEKKKNTQRTNAMPATWTPSKKAYFASFDGWRRAKQSEVTDAMLQAAIAALSNPLGTVIDRDGYRIVLETHYNEQRREHKGATILVRKTVSA